MGPRDRRLHRLRARVAEVAPRTLRCPAARSIAASLALGALVGCGIITETMQLPSRSTGVTPPAGSPAALSTTTLPPPLASPTTTDERAEALPACIQIEKMNDLLKYLFEASTIESIHDTAREVQATAKAVRGLAPAEIATELTAIIDRIDLALPGILDLESATAWQEQLDTEQFAWILSGPETYVLTAWTKQHCLGA